jgi:hypothetical protein
MPEYEEIARQMFHDAPEPEFLGFLEEIDGLIRECGGALRSRQIVALAYMVWSQRSKLDLDDYN